MAQIYLREIRTKVDERFVGIRPRGNKLKPVHMAGGEFRALIGKVYDTEKIKRLSYVVNAKGITPIGNELKEVYTMLTDDDAIESGIRKEDLETLRKAMQDILGADNGVFYNNNSRVRDGMVSFSAGSHYFVTGKGTYEENGEFIAELIKKSCPDLAQYITGILKDAKDPISLLFSPVCSDDVLSDNYVGYNLDEFELFKNNPDKLQAFMESIKRSGDCLLSNFRQNQNYLGQLRMFNFFCIFVLLRYMSMLEAFYCSDGKVRPILADFSSKAGTRLSSVSNASMMSYTLIHSSIARFYAWAYAQELKDYSIEPLNAELYDKVYPLISDCPLRTTDTTKRVLAANYPDEAWADREPVVAKGTAVTGDSYWKGSQHHKNAEYIAEYYGCPDKYAVTEMEEIGIMNAAECFGLKDQVISLRVIVNMDTFLKGEDPESLWLEETDYGSKVTEENSETVDIFGPGMENLFDTGKIVIDAILAGEL